MKVTAGWLVPEFRTSESVEIRPKPDYCLHCSHGQIFGLVKLCPLANFKSIVSVPALVNHLLDSKKCLWYKNDLQNMVTNMMP